MRLDILVRNSVLGLALAGLITAGPVQAQNKDAAKDAAKAEKDATKDAANAQKDATKDAAKAQKDAVKDAKVKKDKDRDPSASTNKTKGKHLAKGHSH